MRWRTHRLQTARNAAGPAERRTIGSGDLWANPIRCHCLGNTLTSTDSRAVLHHSREYFIDITTRITATWITACAQTHLSKTSRIIKMQNAKGHARYRSSACGNVASSVFFKSAQVTLWGSQNRSFQNHAKIPAISPAADTVTGSKDELMARWTSEGSRRRCGRADSADDEIAVRPFTLSYSCVGKYTQSAPPRVIGALKCHAIQPVYVTTVTGHNT